MRSYLPALLWLLIITYLSVTSRRLPVPQFQLLSFDKLAHAAAYGLLVLLLWFGHRGRADLGRYWGITVFLGASVFGAVMEWVQATWFPHRFYELDDMIANVIGAAAGWFIGQRWFGQ
jgi:VanZ family protein